jgi:hypothetical protein
VRVACQYHRSCNRLDVSGLVHMDENQVFASIMARPRQCASPRKQKQKQKRKRIVRPIHKRNAGLNGANT